ncbi:MAG TPA: Holliday junction branch migration protein RuvA [Bacillales bacterium]|nr:Holliday junction branch migration protein RuvA [Bacillales bacterium]
MIAFVDGKVVEINTESIVVEVNGIGYLIHCANPFSFQRYKNQSVKVYTYQYVREDWIALYGFETPEERALFVNLLAVSGIGPKGALAILAACRPDEVAAAVENEDERYLTKFPGVGKKTARQMILDLKGKLTVLGISTPEAEQAMPENNGQQALNEAVEALKSLGYAEREIQKVVKQIAGDDLSADQYVKKALQAMMKR